MFSERSSSFTSFFPLHSENGRNTKVSTSASVQPRRELSSMATLLTLTQFDDARDDDNNKGSHLGIGENVLDSGAPLYVGGIDER